jgi:hypothetical protein
MQKASKHPNDSRVALRFGSGDGDGSQPGIQTMLARFGLPALLFHFTVWVTSLATVFAALSLVGDPEQLLQSLPDFLRERLGGEGGGAAGGLGRAAITLAVVEVIGPARLALTVAVAPTVADAVRKYEWFCTLEETILQKGREVAASFATLTQGAR